MRKQISCCCRCWPVRSLRISESQSMVRNYPLYRVTSKRLSGSHHRKRDCPKGRRTEGIMGANPPAKIPSKKINAQSCLIGNEQCKFAGLLKLCIKFGHSIGHACNCKQKNGQCRSFSPIVHLFKSHGRDRTIAGLPACQINNLLI